MEFEVNRVRGEKRKGKPGGAEKTVWVCYIQLDFKLEFGQLMMNTLRTSSINRAPKFGLGAFSRNRDLQRYSSTNVVTHQNSASSIDCAIELN
jgi:hypothetical protein